VLFIGRVEWAMLSRINDLFCMGNQANIFTPIEIFNAPVKLIYKGLFYYKYNYYVSFSIFVNNLGGIYI
jgi:hypothetical protein